MVWLALVLGCGGSDGDSAASAGHTCDEFCSLYESVCTGGLDGYGDESTCLDTCADWPQGTPDVYQGDSLECRYSHAKSASQDPTQHCPHAGPDGGGVCEGDPL